jgi:tetratricopeptide (TPR) repeat protein
MRRRAGWSSDAVAQTRTDRLTSRYPDSWLAWLTAAYVHEKAGLAVTNSPTAVDRALQLFPRQPFALMLKGYELARQGDRAGALATSQRALRLQPSNEELLWQRASLLSTLGECGPLIDVARTIRQVGHAKLSAQRGVQLERILQSCFRRAAHP